MKNALVLGALLLSFAGAALAGVPDPSQCSVSPSDALGQPVFCPAFPSPPSWTVNTVTVRDSGGAPVAGVTVEFVPSSQILLCPGANLTGVTDAGGQASIVLAGGGCVSGAGSVRVYADGVLIRDYGKARSPDWDNAAPNGLINISDLVSFASEWNGLRPWDCHDYTNTGGLANLPMFGTAFSRSQHCP